MLKRHPSPRPRLIALALAAGLAGSLLSGCGDDKPETLIASAKEYLGKRDTASAIIQLKSALQKSPDSGEARYLLGKSLLDSGDSAAAEVELRKALQARYDEPKVVPELARALVAQVKGARAIEDYAAIQWPDPIAMADLKATLATAYVQQGDTVAAQKATEAALQAVPGFGPAMLMQARLKASANKYDEAFASLDQLLAKEPVNYEALQVKGDLLYFVKSDVEHALAVHRQALAQRKDWLLSHRSIIEILLVSGNIDGAAAQLAEMKKVLPDHPQTRYFEAEMAYLKGDDKAARELAQQLLKVAPDNVKVLLLASSIELRIGSPAQAEKFASKALQIAPDLPVTRRLLGQIYLRSGQAAKAVDALGPLLDKPDVGNDTLVLAAEAALQAGDAKLAESYFTRAAAADPKDTRARTALALTQFSKGKPELGFAQLQEIAAGDKGTAADLALISGRLRQRDFPSALTAIDALERKQPDKPLAAQMRGQIELMQNDRAAARISFMKAAAIDPLYFPAAAALATLDLRDRKLDAAKGRFDKFLAADPGNVQVLMAIAELRAQAGASKEELAGLLSDAIKRNPGVPAPRLALIDLFLRYGDVKSAMAAAQDGASAMPDNAEVLDALGRAQLSSGDVNQSIILFKKLASQQPRSPQPQLRLADAYLVAKNVDDARASLQRALEITPRLLPAQRALVSLELDAGRPEQAMAIVRTVQAERPDQSAGYAMAGEVEAFRKNWPAAIAAYRAGLKRNGATDIAAKLHSALLIANKAGEAQAMADTWLHDHPQDAGFVSYLGDLALSHEDFKSAESRYLEVVKLRPENPTALNNLAWITNAQKKPGALAYAEKADALAPNQPAIMDTMATILADSGQLAKALEVQKKALALAPTQHALQLNLARLYLKAGDKALAKSELDELSKLGEKFNGQSEVGELLKSL